MRAIAWKDGRGSEAELRGVGLQSPKRGGRRSAPRYRYARRGFLRARDGVIVEYATAQVAPEAPWVVLVLPFGTRVSVASKVVAALQNFNVLTWSSRLVLSPLWEPVDRKSLALHRHLADLEDLLVLHGIERYQLVGYCSGAGVALVAARALARRPQQLILVNGEFVLFRQSDCVTPTGRDVDRLLSIAARDAGTARLVWQKLEDSRSTNSHVPQGMDLPYRHPTFLYRYAIGYLAYREVDFADAARSVHLKSHVLAGGRDPITNVQASEYIASHLSGAELYVDPTGGHYEILRRSSATLQRISTIVRTVEDLYV